MDKKEYAIPEIEHLEMTLFELIAVSNGENEGTEDEDW